METMPDQSQEEIILKTEVEGDSPGEERVKIEGGRIGRLCLTHTLLMLRIKWTLVRTNG